jgi:ribosomal protein S19
MSLNTKSKNQKIKKFFVNNKLILISLINDKRLNELKMKCRSSVISKIFNDKKYNLYNGYTYKSFEIEKNFNGLKFGELFMTRKLPKHKK